MTSWTRHLNFPVVGLTGSISSGKTHVAEIAKTFGFLHVNTDGIAKEILKENPEVQIKAFQITGIHPFDAGGLINKAFSIALFSNPAMMREYESYIHPLVFAHVRNLIDTLTPPYPKGLLIESAIWRRLAAIPYFDSMWVIEAPERLREERFLQKHPEGQMLYAMIMKHQDVTSSNIKVPTFFLFNDGRDLQKEVKGVIQETIDLWGCN